MRGVRAEWCARALKCATYALSVVAWAGAIAPLAGADTAANGVSIRVYAIQASGLSTYDCSIQIEVHNQLDVVLYGFAATIDFLDANGSTIAQKPFEMTRIRPTVRRREGLGFKFAISTSRDEPRDMTELVDQCDVLASAEVSLRACETDKGSIFERCLARLVAHSGSELPLVIRQDAVAEAVDYGVVALPEGHRVDAAERAVIERLGLTVSTISEELAWENGLSPGAEGLFVVAVAPGGPAASADLRIGDVIVEIDQDASLTPEDARAALNVLTIERRWSLLLLLDRDGDEVFAVIRVSSD